MHHKSICFIRRIGTGKNVLELDNNKYNKNISDNIKVRNRPKNINEKKEDESIQKPKKDNIPQINMIISEFIEDIPLKRTNSMINLRPHSQTIDSKTTCDTSVKGNNEKKKLIIDDLEDNQDINININQFLISKDLKDNKDSDIKKEIKNGNNNMNSTEKKPKTMYGHLFMEGEKTDTEKNQKIKSHLRSKSISLLREMNPFYKDEIEGSIIRDKDEKITFIYPDILLKSIIFDDFINKNVLLIYHFCQQCFCFVNKEIFFRKIFDCYKFYKKDLSKEKLYNLIEFVNILVIEMFEYYKTINLNECHVSHIIKFYKDLIVDLITSFGNDEKEKNNNEINNTIFRFESNDFSKNEENNTRNTIDNNSIINRKNLIDENLNIEIRDIKIFIYKEKENENDESQKIKENDKQKKIEENEIKNISKNKLDLKITKSKTYRPSSLQGGKSLMFKDFKDAKDADKTQKTNLNLTKNNNSEKEIVLWNIGEVEEKEIEENLENNKETNKSDEDSQKSEKKHQLFRISKTLRKSNIVKIKNTLDEAIIEEEDDIKEKSEEDSKSLYSSVSDSKSNSSSPSKSGSQNENDNEGDKKEENANKNKKDEKITKDIKEKEEENKQKLVLIEDILEKNNIPVNLLSINEKILNGLQYIIILFDKESDGDPGYIDIKEAKDHINFYKTLQNILNKQKKAAIFPSQRQKRLTKSYSFFNLGSIALKSKNVSRDYLKKGYFCVTDWKTEEIGDELMRVSKSLLNKIYPRELYKAIFLKKDKEKTSPNVLECINRFNKLTSFIIEDILSYDFPKERARVYEKWVAIADYCKKSKDYNDLIAIYSALQHYVITGLNLTLKEVKSRTNTLLRQISDFCSVEGNYRNIREDMKNCDKSGEIFIPYLGMFMRDINFFEENSKYINENGCINFEKIEKINIIFQNIFKYKAVPEKASKIKQLKFLENLQDISEGQLEEMANKLEPEFKLDKIPKPGKRPTNIDHQYFAKYAKSLSGNVDYINPLGRKTISFN